jgi:hypothetical protein
MSVVEHINLEVDKDLKEKIRNIIFEEKCSKRYTIIIDDIHSCPQRWSDITSDKKKDHIVNFTKINNKVYPLNKKDLKKYFFRNIIFDYDKQMISHVDIIKK